jgi:hypothetical protein
MSDLLVIVGVVAGLTLGGWLIIRPLLPQRQGAEENVNGDTVARMQDCDTLGSYGHDGGDT